MTAARSDLVDFTYFLAIARHRSYRRASAEIGVSPSGLSHAIKGLEERLGVRLLHRTNRSVTLTAAGEELRSAIEAPFEVIGEAAERLNRFRDKPIGRIRLNVLGDAAALILAPVLPVFIQRYPEIEVEVAISNRMIDMTEEGFDAGIRHGGTVPEDMIAQRLSPDIRWVVGGSPDYLDRYGAPTHPSDLANHNCLKVRLGDGRIYRWEFEKDGESLEIDASGAITLDDGQFGLSLVAGGAGLLYIAEPLIAPLVAAGAVRLVLEDWAPVSEGYQIYYSSRRQVPTGLRLLIDLIREIRPAN
jgi:DNA-binding transcriptional LysR family regulator